MKKTCTCYVSDLPREEAFGLRYGTHDPLCPVYRESKDPVDRVEDDEFRDHYYAVVCRESTCPRPR